MLKYIFILMVFCSTLFANAQGNLIKKSQLMELIDNNSENIMIINFWATWCKPCIKEIPYFDEVNENENVKVLLVSLDFPEDNEKVQNFIEKRKVKSQVVHLNEKFQDEFINSINPTWSGAIPATYLKTKKKEKYFKEGSFDRETLVKLVNSYLNN